MPPVTITVANGRIVSVNPQNVITNPGNLGLNVNWNITGDGSITFANPPIQWANPAPSGYTSFSTSVTGSGNSWNATMPSMSPSTTAFYKYNIVYTSPSGSLDPEVENQGVPPSPGGFFEKPPKGRPDTTPGERPEDKD